MVSDLGPQTSLVKHHYWMSCSLSCGPEQSRVRIMEPAFTPERGIP